MLVKLSAGLLIAYVIFREMIKENMNIRPENNPVLFASKYSELTPYIEAQARHESGNYTNRLSREYNNIFSMTKPYVRPETSLGATDRTSSIDNQTNRWQIYRNYTQAIEDLLLWMDYTRFPTRVSSVEEYATQMRVRGFYTAPLSQYISGMKKFM
jgi:flagellum-specific peptidoglycan hydrolase FlgJ